MSSGTDEASGETVDDVFDAADPDGSETADSERSEPAAPHSGCESDAVPFGTGHRLAPHPGDVTTARGPARALVRSRGGWSRFRT